MQKPLPLAKVKKIYSSRFRGTDLHHMKPKSRKGDSIEFNLFPYLERSHSDYHYVLWNLSIEQVWDLLDRIHHTIFDSGDDFVTPWWFEFCQLDIGNDVKINNFEKDKSERLIRPVSADKLQRNWISAFGGPDLITAEEFMKLMMLFMVFGVKISNKRNLFDNGNLVDFYENSRPSDMRLWAFEVCFGRGGSAQAMKSKIVSIIKRNKYYSDILL